MGNCGMKAESGGSGHASHKKTSGPKIQVLPEDTKAYAPPLPIARRRTLPEERGGRAAEGGGVAAWSSLALAQRRRDKLNHDIYYAPPLRP
jgi:hypothetical protein